MFALPDPEQEIINQLNACFFDFLWDGKIDKIKRNTTFKDYLAGGIRMINIFNFVSAIKLTWIRRLLQDNTNILNIFKFYNNDISLFTQYGPQFIEKDINNIPNPLWKDVFTHYSTFTKK